ncbi:MAG: ribonuclease HI [Candidatus Paceibacterota bacterium]
MENDVITIFTDGSSRGNPGPGGFGAILTYGNNAVEIGGREDNTTNNRMELSAAIEAINFTAVNETGCSMIVVYSDSKYVIEGITKWVYGWVKNDWKTKTKDDVLNKDLWERLFKLTRGKEIDWKYIGGHIGIAGNERADEIATEFADKKSPKLFKGTLEDYPINVFETSHNEAKKTSKSRSKAKAYSYLSMVDGEIKKHSSWEECKARVNGVKGAKYKKALSLEEEKEIIKAWSK